MWAPPHPTLLLLFVFFIRVALSCGGEDLGSSEVARTSPDPKPSLFSFCRVSCFAFSLWTKRCFPCNSIEFLWCSVGSQRLFFNRVFGSCCFVVFLLLASWTLACFLFVLSFRLFFFFKTQDLIACLFRSCFLGPFVCALVSLNFWFVLVCSSLARDKPPKTGHGKKNKMQYLWRRKHYRKNSKIPKFRLCNREKSRNSASVIEQ